MAFIGAVAALLAGGGCSDTDRAIFIVQPSNGDNVTLADDINGDPEDGLQLDVVANTSGFQNGANLVLFVNGTETAEATVDGGRVRFAAVDLPTGDVELRVCEDVTCDVESNLVTVMVSAQCPAVDFLAPAPPAMGGTLVLGADDDEDGEPCGTQFTTTVQIATTAGSGQPARLLIDGSLAAETTVSGTVATFEDVVLNQNATSTLEVIVDTASGVGCRAEYPTPVEVDCEGLACAITAPTTETGFLNSTDDTSTTMPGLQTTVEVTTGAEAVGEPVELFIDGSLAGTQEVGSVGSDGIAAFNTTLEEGVHTVQAHCRDPLGNLTLSALREWTVDLAPCGISIDTIAGLSTTLAAEDRILTPSDDADSSEPGVQVELAGELTGLGCTEVRVGACASIEGVPFATADSGSVYGETVTLSTQASQTLCAEVRDDAGNVARADVTTFFESDAPSVSILSPIEDTRYNAQGGTYTDTSGATRDYVVDLDTTTDSCNAEVRVACGDPRGTVSLFREGDTAPLTGGGPIDCPDSGEAVFDNVRFPSTSTGTPFNLVAHHNVDRLPEATSAPLTILADCVVPELSDRDPQCGDELSPSEDSTGTTADGLQFDVSVVRITSDVPDATLTVIQQDTGNETMAGPEAFGANSVALFQDVNFGSTGVYQLRTCATDALDNTGCIEGCMVTVGDVPTVNITEPLPMDGKVYGDADDCDTGTDQLELQVSATTDAPDGTSATLRIGPEGGSETVTVDTVVSGGAVSECMAAPEGESVPVFVAIGDPPLVGSAEVAVDIDSIPPDQAVGDLMLDSTAVLPRHSRRFDWTPVPDGDGTALEEYILKCADSAISTETDWDAARTYDFQPPVSGTADTGDAVGFRPGTTVHCMLRGADLAGTLTPLGNSVQVAVPDLSSLVVETSQGLELGRDVQGVGDVNGDGVHDVLIAGDGEAYLYFGFGAGATPPAGPVPPDVVIGGPSTGWFGRHIAPLGDFSGDGIADFAISAHIENDQKGAVYIFYGRPDTVSWPATLQVAEPGCQADVCLKGEDGQAGTGPDEGAWFGDGVDAAGDFNGDGTADIAIGAPFARMFQGRVYILFGGQFDPNATVNIPQDSGAVDGVIVDPPAGADGRFGWQVAGLGRALGADSLSDVAITASGGGSSFEFDPSRQGALYVLEGRSPTSDGLVSFDGGTLLADGSMLEVQRANPVGNYGSELANVGDLQSDGFIDIALRHTNIEEVFVFTGTAGGYPSPAPYTITNDSSAPSGDQLGRGIASAAIPGMLDYGDVDGDGLSDLFVGSTQNPDAPGVGQLYYGEPVLPASEPRSSAELTLNPPTTDGTVRIPGYIGDLDGDGAWDLGIGDQDHNGGIGQVVLYY